VPARAVRLTRNPIAPSSVGHHFLIGLSIRISVLLGDSRIGSTLHLLERRLGVWWVSSVSAARWSCSAKRIRGASIVVRSAEKRLGDTFEWRLGDGKPSAVISGMLRLDRGENTDQVREAL